MSDIELVYLYSMISVCYKEKSINNKAHKFTFKINTPGFFFLKKLECWGWIMVYVQIFSVKLTDSVLTVKQNGTIKIMHNTLIMTFV